MTFKAGKRDNTENEELHKKRIKIDDKQKDGNAAEVASVEPRLVKSGGRCFGFARRGGGASAGAGEA